MQMRSLSPPSLPQLPPDLEAAALEAAWQGGHAAVLDRMQEQHTAEMASAVSEALEASEQQHQVVLARAVGEAVRNSVDEQQKRHRLEIQIAVMRALERQEGKFALQLQNMKAALEQKEFEKREIVESAARANDALRVRIRIHHSPSAPVITFGCTFYFLGSCSTNTEATTSKGAKYRPTTRLVRLHVVISTLTNNFNLILKVL
jgi:hypothetical protein